jgi:hypothetical protein
MLMLAKGSTERRLIAATAHGGDVRAVSASRFRRPPIDAQRITLAAKGDCIGHVLRLPVIREIEMFLKNQWYVVAWDFEVQEKPLGRVICGEPVVLFRDSEGRLAALEDVCPHRLVPLSLGSIEGDAIITGFCWTATGAAAKCREATRSIPSSKLAPIR